MSQDSGGGTKNVTNTDPWSGQQPYLTDIFQQAQNQFQGGGPQYYPNAGYVPFAPQTQQGLAQTEQRAQGAPWEQALGQYATNSLNQGQFNLAPAGYGSDQLIGGIGAGQGALAQGANPFLQGVGQNQQAQTASGQYLNSNPYLDQMFNAAANPLVNQFQNTVIPGINAGFGGAGRTGSEAQFGALQDATQGFGNSLADLSANIYGGNYAQERQNQLGAANSLTSNALNAGGALQQGGVAGIGGLGGLYGNISQDQARAGTLSPQASQFDWNNIDRLLGVGSAVQGQSQNILNDAMARYNFGQLAPGNALQQYAGLINGQYGGQQQQTIGQPGSNPYAGTAGGALAGYGIGSQIGQGYGGYGALLGGLLGLGSSYT